MNINDEIKVEVDSKLLYSCNPPVSVNAGETYVFKVEPNQTWKDWWITTTPNGFINPLTWFGRKRVKNAKCFCLCGTIGEDEYNHFKLGNGSFTLNFDMSGSLFFFPNDHIDYYSNNSGKIVVSIKRLS